MSRRFFCRYYHAISARRSVFPIRSSPLSRGLSSCRTIANVQRGLESARARTHAMYDTAPHQIRNWVRRTWLLSPWLLLAGKRNPSLNVKRDVKRDRLRPIGLIRVPENYYRARNARYRASGCTNARINARVRHALLRHSSLEDAPYYGRRR